MERIPGNIILKSNYFLDSQLFQNHYISNIVNQIMCYIDQNKNYLKHIEVEAKLGTFIFKGQNVKYFEKIDSIFVIPETTKEKYDQYNFDDGIDQKDFYLIWTALENESKLENSEIQFLGTFILIDTVYINGKRKSIIHDLNQNNITEEIITKQNKYNINVRNNGKDFRVTCCLELPCEIDNETVATNRKKFRLKYKFRYFEIDLSITKTGDKIAYEIEIEIVELENMYKVINGNELMQVFSRFVNNVFNLYTATSYSYTSKLYVEKKKKVDNIFGNYLENNI